MKQNAFKNLSNYAWQEINSINKTKQTAIGLMFQNLNSEEASYNYLDIANRMQVQYYILSPELTALQSNGVNGWWQNEAFEPNLVDSKILPLVEDKEQKFSSFALKELENKNSLRYPLMQDYAIDCLSFKDENLQLQAYNEFIQKVETNLGVKVNSNGTANTYTRKKGFFVASALIKIKNMAFKLMKKPSSYKVYLEGKLVLQKESSRGKAFTSVDKTVKIYDTLFKVCIIKALKEIKQKNNKQITKKLKFASRLFANILMCRIHNFADPNINKKVEKSLCLQFTNVINKIECNPSQLKLISALGINAVEKMCNSLKLNANYVINSMKFNGFDFNEEPKTIKEAIITAQETDCLNCISQMSIEAQQEQINEGERTKKLTKIAQILKTKLNAEQLKQKDIEDKAEMRKRITQILKNKMNITSKKLKESLQGFALNAEKKEQQQKLLNLLKERINKKNIENAINQKSKINEIYEQQEQDLLKTSYYQNIASILSNHIKKRAEEEQQRQNFKATNKQSKEIGKRAIEKSIDKQIIKILSEKNTKIVNALNAHSFKRVGGKEAGVRLATITSNLLAYYENSLFSKRKVSEKAKNNETIYSKARQISVLLTLVKQDIAEKILKEQNESQKNDGERVEKYINRLFKNISKTPENPEGQTIKKYFEDYIDKITRLYAQMEITEIV